MKLAPVAALVITLAIASPDAKFLGDESHRSLQAELTEEQEYRIFEGK